MTWQEFYQQFIDLEPGIAAIALRLGCAMLIGVVIGMEREFTHRPAGLRTHILVALGACAISIAGEMVFAQYGKVADPTRLSAQVITGVGFLGAGTIMKEGASVKGLTTAASVWAVACLGLAAGFGYYALALLGMVFIMFTLTLLETFQRKFLQVRSTERSYVLETADISASLALLNSSAQENGASVFDLTAEQIDDGHRLTFRIWFSGRRSKKHSQRFFEALASAPELQSVQQFDSKTGTAV